MSKAEGPEVDAAVLAWIKEKVATGELSTSDPELQKFAGTKPKPEEEPYTGGCPVKRFYMPDAKKGEQPQQKDSAGKAAGGKCPFNHGAMSGAGGAPAGVGRQNSKPGEAYIEDLPSDHPPLSGGGGGSRPAGTSSTALEAATARNLKGVEVPCADGRGLRVGIVRTRWNTEVVDALTQGCYRALVQDCNVSPEDIFIELVPGSYELPFAARCMAESWNVDAIVCVGCLIKGETMHFEYICEAVTQGIMRINLEKGVPTMFGVLACLTEEQARVRAGLGGSAKAHNHGVDWGRSAVEMALLKRRGRHHAFHSAQEASMSGGDRADRLTAHFADLDAKLTLQNARVPYVPTGVPATATAAARPSSSSSAAAAASNGAAGRPQVSKLSASNYHDSSRFESDDFYAEDIYSRAARDMLDDADKAASNASVRESLGSFQR